MRNSFGSRWVAALATCAGLSSSGGAVAQPATADASRAQSLFDEGRRLMIRSELAEACPKFEESQRLEPALGTLLNWALCLEREGSRPAEAFRLFERARAQASSEGHADAERVAAEHAHALAARLPKLVVVVGAAIPPEVRVSCDGVPLPASDYGRAIPVAPGPHRLEASAPGYEAWTVTFTLPRTSETFQQVVPTLVASSARSRDERSPGGLDTSRALALGSAVVGVAGITIGTVYGLRSLAKRADADEHCSGARCRDTAGVELRDEARSAGNVSTAAFLVGAAGVGGAVALWLTAPPSSESEAHVGVAWTASSVALRGRF